MTTFTLKKQIKKKTNANLSNLLISGNLLIENTSCSVINLENCFIEGHLIIDNNKSVIKLTGSRIRGSIIVNYVKDGDFLHFDRLNTAKESSEDTYESGSVHLKVKKTEPLFQKGESSFWIEDSVEDKGKVTFEFENKEIELIENSLLIMNSQIKLNLDSSIIKGDVFILDSTIAAGTFDMSNATFGTENGDNKFEIISTGIASDIEAKNVKFFGTVKFDDIRFDNEIYFSDSQFLNQVEFIDCTMYQECYFEGATFEENVDVSETIFQGKASFKNIKWKNNAYMKMHKGSAFLGYVDMTREKLENYLFINVRGLRNIFYSLINNEHEDSLQFLHNWSNTCKKQFLEKLNSPTLQTIYKIEDRFNDFFDKIKNIFTFGKEQSKKQENSGEIVKLKYDNPINLLNIEIEMYVEARRAMEDMAKEELITECHILEMEAQRRLASKDFVKWLRFTFLKYTTKYGESPFRIFAFIIFDWIFFSMLYWLIIKGHEFFGSNYPYNHTNGDLVKSNFLESISHSADNLLSLNFDIDSSCCIFTVIVTLFQGFVNIMIIALMTQVVFRKLDLR